jgi:hypothetical protein
MDRCRRWINKGIIHKEGKMNRMEKKKVETHINC